MTIFLVIVMVIVVAGVYFYNGLLTQSNKVKSGWTEIETILKKRYELITNLLEFLKTSSGLGASNLTSIADVKTKAMQATSLKEKADFENQLSEKLNDLITSTENSQTLQSNQNYVDFKNSLKEIEDQLSVATRFYNGAVNEFNIKVKTPPNNFIAKFLSLHETELFTTQEVEPAQTSAPVTESEPEPTPEPNPVPEPKPAPEAESTPTPAEQQPITTQESETFTVEEHPQTPEPTTVEPEPNATPEPTTVEPEQPQTPEPTQEKPEQPQPQQQ